MGGLVGVDFAQVLSLGGVNDSSSWVSLQEQRQRNGRETKCPVGFWGGGDSA